MSQELFESVLNEARALCETEEALRSFIEWPEQADFSARESRAVNAIDIIQKKDLDYILEQPCRTYEECQQVRRVADQPMKLDECVTGTHAAQRIVADKGAEVCCLKISNLGGLTKAKKVRDYLIENRIPVVSEDTWGGEIATAAVAHFAASTPQDYLINSTDLYHYNTRSTGKPGPETRQGKLYASDMPGLGVEPDFESLGQPVAVYGDA